MRLVVVGVVDQLRSDLLDRYGDLWTGGFRRLLDGGYRFTEATHEHAYTETAAGHATLSTGVFPSRHGIPGNEWRERAWSGGWQTVYSVFDSTSALIGDATSRACRCVLVWMAARLRPR